MYFCNVGVNYVHSQTDASKMTKAAEKNENVTVVHEDPLQNESFFPESRFRCQCCGRGVILLHLTHSTVTDHWCPVQKIYGQFMFEPILIKEHCKKMTRSKSLILQ